MIVKGFSTGGYPSYLTQKIHPVLNNAVPRLKFCDIGVNILDDMFAGTYHSKDYHPSDKDLLFERAATFGVDHIICTATTVEESKQTLDFCRSFNRTKVASEGLRLYSTVGIHPTRCNEISTEENAISQLDSILADGILDKTVVAIGECGLDYDRLFFCSKEIQLDGFRKQIDLISKYNLPAFFHNRNTDGDFLKIVTEERHKLSAGGVVHSFTGSMDEMLELTRLGFYIGINGCSLKSDENLAVARAVPEELLLLETDAPWCGIKPTHSSFKHVSTKFSSVKKEKFQMGYMVKDRNEPCAIIQVLEVLAAIRSTDPNTLADQVLINSHRLFNI